MKILLFFIGALFCSHFAYAGSIGNLEQYERVSKKDQANLDDVIYDGTIAALNLAASENIIEAKAVARYQIENVGRVAKSVRDDVTSYYIIVRVSDAHYPDVKAIIGYVIDRNNASGALTLRGYKMGPA